MNDILIIIDGILAKHFLEKLCFEKASGYFFTIICQNKENLTIQDNEGLKFYDFDPTSIARLELIMKPYKQAFIYMQNEFETKKTYEALRSLDLHLEINIMDFWGLGINDENCNLIDAKTTLSKRLIDFLPNVAKTAQYIGLGVGEVMEAKIPEGSIFAYRHISSIQQKRWRIALVYRNSKIHFIKPSFVLKPNDRILMVGDPVVLQNIFHAIMGNEGQFPMPFGNNAFALIDMKNMSENTQNKIIDTLLSLKEKTNTKKNYFHIINPTLNSIYEKLKILSEKGENVFFDFENTSFEFVSEFIKDKDIGVFITDTKHFEKEKKRLYELKIPILKVGNTDFCALKESVILSADESELENQANVIMDLSKQLKFEVNLYYYNPHSKDSTIMQEYFTSLSKLYDKNIQIIDKSDINPLLSLEYREDLLQFISFKEELLEHKFSRALSVNLNKHYDKMYKNFQLFIPIN